LNVKSTPTFFINGRRLEGLLDAQKFNILLDEASRLLP
ncbi:thioredoxin domain-containing protein, partial [bacterium]|nr:thioredoxin domain-containing protein [bacterium]